MGYTRLVRKFLAVSYVEKKRAAPGADPAAADASPLYTPCGQPRQRSRLGHTTCSLRWFRACRLRGLHCSRAAAGLLQVGSGSVDLEAAGLGETTGVLQG